MYIYFINKNGKVGKNRQEIMGGRWKIHGPDFPAYEYQSGDDLWGFWSDK